jgi:3',5'-cyclic AMP phosphodiesterase CpdA
MTRFVHIADLHFGDENTALVEDFLNQLPDLKADVVVVAGDLTQAGARDEFTRAAEFLGAITPHVVLTPGNHDTPLLNLVSRLFRPWRRLQKAVATVSAPDFSNDAIQIESFNSARGVQMRLDWSLGVVSKKKLAAPLAALSVSGAATRVLTAHHPILSPLDQAGRARTHRAPEFARQIAEHADLILTGHLHQQFACPLDLPEKRSWFVGASTAFSSRTRDVPAGFNLIDVAPDNFRLEPYRAEPVGRSQGFRAEPEIILPRLINP